MIRACYDGVRSRVAVSCSGGRTKRSFGVDVDINRIMDRFHKTGVLPMGKLGGRFGDVSMVGSYEDCLVRVSEIQNAFLALPAKVRDRFRNNPSALLAFLGDEKNREEAVSLGLVPAPSTDKAPVVPVAPVASVAP